MRALRAAFAFVLLAACGAPPSTPSDVVAAYFADLGRDPIRMLPLTTDAYHSAHGLWIVASGEPRVDRNQVAWLAIQNRADFEQLARGLVATPRDASEQGDVASVAVRVAPAKGPAFVQRFQLVRAGPTAAWRIDAVEQSGVDRGNAMAAFVAHPTEIARRALEQALRR